MLQALKTGLIYSLYFQEREHTHTSASANTKPSALIHTPSSLQYTHTVISTNMHREIHTSICTLAQNTLCHASSVLAFHFNNSPPALIVITSVSGLPLNLELLSKGVSTKITLCSNLVCVCSRLLLNTVLCACSKIYI